MSEPLQIIIAGAAGRMGQTLVNLIMSENAYELSGAVERQEELKKLQALPCAITDNLADAFYAAPNAILIDFTAPDAAINSAEIAAKMKRKMVIGATGFDNTQKEKLKELAKVTPLFWSANMGVGLNALLRFLPELEVALGNNYDLEIMEIHHKRKKDAPSGTALMLGDVLAKARGWDLDKTRNSRRDGITGERKHEEIGVQALRGGDVVGIHSVYFFGPGEIIEIKHQIESRENFAQGALRAASWLNNQKPGSLYSMQDAIGTEEK